MTDIQVLLDDLEIRQLAFRYCRALDTKDWTLLDDVFVADATAELGTSTTLVGIDAIRSRIRSALEHLDDSQHLVSNHEIAVDGDTATHRCYLQAQHVRRSAVGGPNYIVAGRYEDRLVRTGDGWRISHRTLTVMWTDGNVAVAHGD
jgi:3-phenylpropionate/cinnamic acid dioxygenase small subunit